MKKHLLLFCLVANYFIGQGQNQISFESSEGYTLGSIENQNDWIIYYPDEDPNFTPEINVSNLFASDGTQAFRVQTQVMVDVMGGAKLISPIQESTSVTFDVFIDKLDPDDDLGSEIILDLIDENYDPFAEINFSFDGTVWGGSYGYLSEIDGVTFNYNQWHQVRYELDYENSNFKIFLDDNLVYSDALDTAYSFAGLDFYMFDINASFNIDNIRIQPLDTMNTTDLKTPKINLYPNPTTDWVVVDGSQKIQQIDVYDLSGKNIKSIQSSDKINLSELPKGNYVLRIKSDKQTFTKIVIKK